MADHPDLTTLVAHKLSELHNAPWLRKLAEQLNAAERIKVGRVAQDGEYEGHLIVQMSHELVVDIAYRLRLVAAALEAAHEREQALRRLWRANEARLGNIVSSEMQQFREALHARTTKETQ